MKSLNLLSVAACQLSTKMVEFINVYNKLYIQTFSVFHGFSLQHHLGLHSCCFVPDIHEWGKKSILLKVPYFTIFPIIFKPWSGMILNRKWIIRKFNTWSSSFTRNKWNENSKVLMWDFQHLFPFNYFIGSSFIQGNIFSPQTRLENFIEKLVEELPREEKRF